MSVDDMQREIARLRSDLEHYGDHTKECVLSNSTAGRPTENGGYEVNVGGVWYQVLPEYQLPKCTCGFHDAVSGLYEGESK